MLIVADYAVPKSGNIVASVIALGRKLRKEGNHIVFVFPKERDWTEWFRKEHFCVEVIEKTEVLQRGQR